jgi:hypothetical protein
MGAKFKIYSHSRNMKALEGIDEWWEFPTTHKLFRIKIVLWGAEWIGMEIKKKETDISPFNEWARCGDMKPCYLHIYTTIYILKHQALFRTHSQYYRSLYSCRKMLQVERLKPQSTTIRVSRVVSNKILFLISENERLRHMETLFCWMQIRLSRF